LAHDLRDKRPRVRPIDPNPWWSRYLGVEKTLVRSVSVVSDSRCRSTRTAVPERVFPATNDNVLDVNDNVLATGCAAETATRLED
jgi:hypothetical protein